MNTPRETILLTIDLLIWIIFVAYWLISAIGVKRNVKGTGWGRSFTIRIIAVIIIIFILQVTPVGQLLGDRFSYAVQVIGVILCAAGVAFAIWARYHLGRDWSGTPSMKEGHELVTSGPYKFVRHPIYTGVILALFGSGLVNGIIWLAVFVIFTIVFLRRISIEERYMMQLFPDKYPEYKKHTKALIPFVW
jgi:protein-S-isoprenylcysteine O-methyltransferase Ste14